MKALDRTKTGGCDLVHPHVMKECSTSMSHTLFLLFKKSIETGTIPDTWKKANITPLFKKGSRLKASNFGRYL
jgi:hypothetical protein